MICGYARVSTDGRDQPGVPQTRKPSQGRPGAAPPRVDQRTTGDVLMVIRLGYMACSTCNALTIRAVNAASVPNTYG